MKSFKSSKKLLLLSLSADVLPLRRPKRTINQPIKLLLNPDHMFLKLGLALDKLRTRDIITRQAEFNTVEAGINIGNPAVQGLDDAIPAANDRN